MTLSDFLWGVLTLYVLVFCFAILWRVLDDVFRDPARTGWAKTGWVLFLLVLPVIGMVVYLIGNGTAMTKRAMDHSLAVEERQRARIRDAAGTADRSTADDARAVTASEDDTIKAKALAD